MSEALQNQLEQELPPSQIPETRFEARRIAEIAAERLGNYLNSEGYFSAVATPGFEPGPPIVPHVTVDPGARFKLASVGIDYLGTRVPDRVDAASLSAISPQTDDFITPEAVIQSEGAIISTLRDEGYAFARAEPPHVIGDAAAATLSVTYRIDPGAKVVLGSVDFGDGLRMRRRALDVLVPFSEGTLYHPDRLAEFNRRLGATRLFSVFNAQLSPTPSRITPDGAAVHNILLTLIERDRYTISAGASFSSSEGAGVELGWTRRNFTRRGDILTVRAIAAAQERRLGIEWRYPHALGYARNLELSANAGREETDAFDRDSLVATISLDIERNPRLTYAFAASNDFTRETDTQGERDLQILSISGAARLDQTDSVLDPKKGWRVDIRLEPGTVIGDEAANYVSTVGQASYYQPLDEQARWIAATRLRSGFVFGADTLNLPTSRRFFAGGGGSARGYAFQSIGPEDSTGQPVGGRGLMEAAAELRWRRSKTLGFAAFIDGASVTARDVPTFNDMRFGVGIGVRYYTIVGPIRLDIATPLDPRDDDDPVQLYISIGQAF
ncbi:MAG: BamA/TamA family outer membrane protein [Pseudomonadota bacterium]